MSLPFRSFPLPVIRICLAFRASDFVFFPAPCRLPSAHFIPTSSISNQTSNIPCCFDKEMLFKPHRIHCTKDYEKHWSRYFSRCERKRYGSRQLRHRRLRPMRVRKPGQLPNNGSAAAKRALVDGAHSMDHSVIDLMALGAEVTATVSNLVPN